MNLQSYDTPAVIDIPLFVGLDKYNPWLGATIANLRAVVVLLLSCGFLSAQETPLHELPSTPSLEMKFVDKAIDPCIDFYKYACGQWNKLNPIPADLDAVSQTDPLDC